MIFNGVRLPDDLRVRLERGELVVFAGAGVSMPPPSSLPSFVGLVSELTGIDQKAVKNPEQLLGRLVKENKKVHELTAKRMLTNTKPTDLHREIVRLFGSAERVRIVTTNFDNHFTDAAKEVFPSKSVNGYHAPALPLGDDFDGIVYLHGSARVNPLAQVLTDKDFGKAYLTQGRARDFLISLFAKYAVVFVGYSHNDVDVSYLARGMNVGGIAPRWVFVPTTTSQEDKERWAHLEIETIQHPVDPANKENERQPLTDFFASWAKHQQQTILEHAAAVRSYAAGLPPEGDAEAEYLLYCLGDPHLAEELCKAITHPAWLGWLEARGLLDSCFPTGGNLPTDFKPHESVLAHWLCTWVRKNHPELLLALIQRRGGAPSELFLRRLGQQLWTANNKETEPNFARWVSILLAADTSLQSKQTWSYILKSCRIPEHSGIALRIFDLLTTPQLRLQKHFDFSNSDASEEVKKEASKRQVDFTVEWPNESEHYVPEFWRDEFKPHLKELSEPLAAIATKHLLSAHHLLRDVGKASERYESLSWSISSIAPHEQNRDPLHRILSLLVEILREIFDNWLVNDLPRAEALLTSWRTTPTPLFKRLALYGLNRHPRLSADEKLGWLLQNELLFAFGLKKEVFDVLASAYPAAREEIRRAVVERIERGIEGPEAENLEANTKAYEQFNALQWLLKSKPDCTIAQSALKKISDAHPDFGVREHPDFEHWHGPVGFVDPKEGFDFNQISNEPPEKYLDDLLAAKENSLSRDRWDFLSNLRILFEKSRAWGQGFMEAAAKLKAFDADFWRSVFSAWQDILKSKEDWSWILDRIERLPVEPGIYAAACSLLSGKLWASELNASAEMAARGFEISIKAWTVCRAGKEPLDSTHQDWLTSAINHPGGWIGECWIQHANYLRAKVGKDVKLPPLLTEKLIEALSGTDAVSVFARIAITPYVAYLFLWDSNLVKQHVLPLFDWSRDRVVAQQTWSVSLDYERGRNFELEKILLPHYRQFAAEMSLLLKQATEEQEQFSSHTIQSLGWHLASLAMQGFANPVETGFFNEFLPLLPDAAREAMADSMGKHLAQLPAEDRTKVWNVWLKDYLVKRTLGVPASISYKESNEFADWCLGMGDLFPEMVELLGKMPVSGVWVHKVAQDLVGNPLLEKFPKASCEYLNILLRDEKYPMKHEELGTIFIKLEKLIGGSPELAEFERLLFLRGWKKDTA